MENVVKQTVLDSTNLLRSYKPYDLANFKLAVLKIDPSPRRRSHLGGMYAKGPGISLAGKLIQNSTKIVKDMGFGVFKEYPSFEEDSIIGSFFFTNLDNYVAATTAHEMAHAAQFYLMKTFKKEKDRDYVGHQAVFKELYGLLRTSLINPKLEPQLPLKKQYQAIIREAKIQEFDRVFCI